ncbi:hypothetical protein DAPPUDRAFT_119334 [Daphnia pulex]|uniref:Uncharacterized protein n=1 Tax=Daphnia pulex TaxID=6669 RepID=E9HY82_DAPPU|nr:hypothetical protein DAPPUDRAFT_119334 [Daphnia pulex]|eukprot:EFX63298.1 hypothetical protein DAPPUDRAFT_119334 [Daphnia pulex]
MDRYGCDEPPTETYAGGNLAIVWLKNDERYLVHSAIEPFDCQMCLTRMTADDMKNHPLESVSTKTPFNDGTVYQIAVPHQSGCWDPSFQQQNEDPLFATRQFHTTILWKVEKRETGSLPIITNVQECSDLSSTVRYVEFNQFDWGEFCELRSQEIKISERGLYGQYFSKRRRRRGGNQYRYEKYTFQGALGAVWRGTLLEGGRFKHMSQMIEDLVKRLEASKYTRLHKYVTLPNGGKYCNAAAAPKTKFLGPLQRKRNREGLSTISIPNESCR